MLSAPSGASSNRRPHQLGRVHGTRTNGTPGSCRVEWLIDSGADVAVVQKQVGALFTTKATGATASPTSGGPGILMVTGLDIEMEIVSANYSYPRRVRTDVGIKSSNDGSNIVGVAELDVAAVTLIWSAAQRAGALIEDRAMTPDGRYCWHSDPLILDDASRLLTQIRRADPNSGPLPANPDSALHAIQLGYQHEVERLLSGFVGYREARAVMSAAIDAWNSHLKPAAQLSAMQRHTHADEVESATSQLLALCSTVERPEVMDEIERVLRRHASDIRRHNG